MTSDNIETKQQLAQAVNSNASQIRITGKLADLLNWSMLSSQTSLYVRVPLCIVTIILIFIASSQIQIYDRTTLAIKLVFGLTLVLIIVSLIVDIFLASRIGYTTAKKLAGRYSKHSYTQQQLVVKLRTDI